MNNNEEISKVMSKYWEESDENSNNEDKNKNNEIYKIIALQCAKKPECKE
jgi:hypothetical protein